MYRREYDDGEVLKHLTEDDQFWWHTYSDGYTVRISGTDAAKLMMHKRNCGIGFVAFHRGRKVTEVVYSDKIKSLGG